MKKSVLILFIMITSCFSSKLVEEYKNPKLLSFDVHKVLVIFLTSDKELKAFFEKTVVRELKKENTNAVKSIGFFESEFISNIQSIEELDKIKKQLLKADFDAILFAKITGKESRINLLDTYRNVSNSYKILEANYYGNQDLYFKNQQEPYEVYITETKLFYISSEKKHSLLWRGKIEVVDKGNLNANMHHYLTVLKKCLRENKLLIYEH